ncbi:MULTISPECIES: FAD-binding protein [unclassified Lentimicrobium]|uniref:FAD-dependent oxidoreductase n=1 Tax=unclassified Lentimicrobium TaxID=2677434 RepID=UPI0015565865|nr:MULTISPECIES: FAD-binding protein [unclassified Lentimicrobium]NPD44050.1 FAD-binding protein [Lentimicrobium sp. S6]NPD85902.1 FAD-binding protein [Lentimicrobium sp. L6]
MSKKISRKEFITVLGAAAAGITASTSLGINSGWAANEAEIQPNDMESENYHVDVLVIGSGMAGLFAAVKSHDAGAKTMMVSKGRLGSSGQTPFAKGIFEYDAKTSKYTIDQFVVSVGKSALGTNNSVYTRQVAEHSQARVKELREWGFFNSPLYYESFSKPLQDREISVIERVTISHLIKENGKIAGAAGFSIDENKIYFFNAKSVILCTGAGGFKPNGFPINDLTHDGTIMAYHIGAKVTGKEWNDGHAGQSKNAAACYDGWRGMFDKKPETTSVSIHHDLGMDMNYLAYVNGNPLKMSHPGDMNKMDISGGPYRPVGFNQNEKQRERPKDGPPPRDGKKGKGGPPGMGGSMVGGSSAGLAIHKSEGIVPINDKCESNIPGLYAAGDALGSYMAGAIYTQIGSSLAGSAVQGAIAGEAAALYAEKADYKNISLSKIQMIHDEITAPLKRESGYSPAWVTQTLQGIMMPNFILYIKKENLMKAALAYIEELRDHHMTMLRAADLHELRLAHETANMIISAEMKLKASLMRTESRCSHYRLDYPDLDNENWQAWINIYKGQDGDMKFEKQAFGSWPNE